MAPGLSRKRAAGGKAAVSYKEIAISENTGPTRTVASPAMLPNLWKGRGRRPMRPAGMGLKLTRPCEPQRGRAPWL